MIVSDGDFRIFVDRPISAVFVGLCILLIGLQVYFWQRGGRVGKSSPHKMQIVPVGKDTKSAIKKPVTNNV
jgi:TctA family transporter